jgi:hypothetical protein
VFFELFELNYFTECPALNGSKTKQFISSTIKFIREIDTFSNTGLHKVPNMLIRSQYGHHLWHDTRQDCFQVLRQVLASISLLTHSAALKFPSRN